LQSRSWMEQHRRLRPRAAGRAVGLARPAPCLRRGLLQLRCPSGHLAPLACRARADMPAVTAGCLRYRGAVRCGQRTHLMGLGCNHVRSDSCAVTRRPVQARLARRCSGSLIWPALDYRQLPTVGWLVSQPPLPALWSFDHVDWTAKVPVLNVRFCDAPCPELIQAHLLRSRCPRCPSTRFRDTDRSASPRTRAPRRW
jgi:hypothetical protein